MEVEESAIPRSKLFCESHERVEMRVPVLMLFLSYYYIGRWYENFKLFESEFFRGSALRPCQHDIFCFEAETVFLWLLFVLRERIL